MRSAIDSLRDFVGTVGVGTPINRQTIRRAVADYDQLVKVVQEAATLLDFEATLGPPEHQAVLREVVKQLTAALNEGAMSNGHL